MDRPDEPEPSSSQPKRHDRPRSMARRRRSARGRDRRDLRRLHAIRMRLAMREPEQDAVTGNTRY